MAKPKFSSLVSSIGTDEVSELFSKYHIDSTELFIDNSTAIMCRQTILRNIEQVDEENRKVYLEFGLDMPESRRYYWYGVSPEISKIFGWEPLRNILKNLNYSDKAHLHDSYQKFGSDSNAFGTLVDEIVTNHKELSELLNSYMSVLEYFEDAPNKLDLLDELIVYESNILTAAIERLPRTTKITDSNPTGIMQTAVKFKTDSFYKTINDFHESICKNDYISLLDSLSKLNENYISEIPKFLSDILVQKISESNMFNPKSFRKVYFFINNTTGINIEEVQEALGENINLMFGLSRSFGPYKMKKKDVQFMEHEQIINEFKDGTKSIQETVRSLETTLKKPMDSDALKVTFLIHGVSLEQEDMDVLSY